MQPVALGCRLLDRGVWPVQLRNTREDILPPPIREIHSHATCGDTPVGAYTVSSRIQPPVAVGAWAARLPDIHPPLHGPCWIFGLVVAVLAACAVLAAYLSHLAAGVPSPSPQILLWPISRQMLRPKWVPRVRERSLAGYLLETGVTLVPASVALAAWGARPVPGRYEIGGWAGGKV